MSIVALISDLGTKDHYVSLVKAALLNHNPHVIPVDVSHSLLQGEIVEAAFMLRSVWESFPFGTVFLNGVSSMKHEGTEHIIIEYKNRYLITADNGTFSLMYQYDEIEDFRVFLLQIDGEDDKRFPQAGVFAKAAAIISQGNTPENWCELHEDMKRLKGLEPYSLGQDLIIQVIYIDHFGNLYFNLTKKLFDEVGKGRSFAIPFKPQTTINRFHERFTDVDEGREVAFWGQNDFLIISMNRGAGGKTGGKFNRLMGHTVGDSLTISFHGDENR